MRGGVDFDEKTITEANPRPHPSQARESKRDLSEASKINLLTDFMNRETRQANSVGP